MSERLRLFTKILIAELEDLEDDIAAWGRFLEEKHRREKVTEYVFLQNSALLGQELAGIKKMVEAIADEPPPEGLRGCADAACIRDFFVDLVRKKARQYEFQRAIEQLAIKKIDKVCAYIAAEA
ncbi:MAG TPA: hypothetical protein PK542_07005 [Treponemataceae bacterium]|nr:hypothetical protein [Treponemataceae bacterium]HPS44219.1 hypothetical protein [Treponemataceae bacterium]